MKCKIIVTIYLLTNYNFFFALRLILSSKINTFGFVKYTRHVLSILAYLI